MNVLLDRTRGLLKTGFFHIFGSSVINKIISFLSSIVLVRILSKTEYGVFTYAWNIYSILILFNGMGIESAVLQLSSEKSGDVEYANRTSNFGTKFGLKFNFILCGLLLGIGLFAPLKITRSRVLLCALCALPFFQFVFNMTSSYLRAQKRNQEYAKLQVVNSALVFLASTCFAFVIREMGLVVGHYIAYVGAVIVGYFVFHVHLLNGDKGDLGEDTKPLLKISFITMLNNGLSQLMYLIDVFVLGIVDPQETILASYKVATMIPTALGFIPLSMIIYLYPYFAQHKNDKEWCIKRYKQVLIGLGSVNLFLAAFLFAFAPLIVRIVFGAQYLDAVPVFRVLAINYFFSGTFRTLSGNLLVTQRKLKFNLGVAIFASSVNIVADYLLISNLGSIGAAYATMLVVLLTSVLNTVYLIITFRKIPDSNDYIGV